MNDILDILDAKIKSKELVNNCDISNLVKNFDLNLIRMGFFGTADRWEDEKGNPP